jgi:hypothetical protein
MRVFHHYVGPLRSGIPRILRIQRGPLRCLRCGLLLKFLLRLRCLMEPVGAIGAPPGDIVRSNVIKGIRFQQILPVHSLGDSVIQAVRA